MVESKQQREQGVELPAGLVEGLSVDERDALGSWWASLAPDERASLSALSGDEDVVLAVVDHGELAVLLEARFVEHAEPHDGITLEPEEEWLAKTAFLEWIHAHPELLPAPRVFHICHAHAKAREALNSGVIPASFACPFAREGCPMRRLLAQRAGCDVMLSKRGNATKRFGRSIDAAGGVDVTR